MKWSLALAITMMVIGALLMWRFSTCDVARVDGRVVYWMCD